MPTVSVVLPTYNRAHLVGRAICSILDQTYRDFELIVIDDGSMDNTEEVIKGFDDPRIHYIRHYKNRGGAAARNTGIKASHGEYIAFQGSDDEWWPEKLEKQMKVFETSPLDVGVVYTGFYLIKDDSKTYVPNSRIKIKEGHIYNELLMGNFIADGTAVVRKDCYEKAGMYDECLPRFQDWEIFIRISKYYQFRYVPEPLLNAKFTSDSISANKDALIKAFELIVEKHFQNLKNNRKIFASVQYLIGNNLCQAGCMCEGKKHLSQALRLYPLNINYLVAAFAALFGKNAYSSAVELKRIIRATYCDAF